MPPASDSKDNHQNDTLTDPAAPNSGSSQIEKLRQAMSDDPRPDENGVYQFFVGGRLTAPVLVQSEEFEFNQIIQKGRGTITLTAEIVVDDDGSIREATLRHGVNPEIDELFLDTLRRFRFEPATLDGEPVPVRFFHRVRWEAQ